jgi:L-malate glycosyltransferase
MRITFVLPFVNLTGGIRVLLQYANALHDEGHAVIVVYPLWPYRYHYSRATQVEEFRKAVGAAPRVGWCDLRCRLLRVPVIANPFVPGGDVIVATSWPTAYAVARLHRSRGVKVHAVFHHESGTGPEDRIRGVYRLPFRRLTFSEQVRDLLQRQFECTISDVVPNGIDTTAFFPDGAREPRSVLMLYHDDPRKGAAEGIEALTRLRRRLPDVRVRMCGTVLPRRLPSWVEFEFHPTDADLRRRYSTSTAFLYPSRDEGFGLPPLEAMACGCPTVTTAVGAVPEFAADGRNALIVQPRDVEGMAARLERLIVDAPLRGALSACGLETASRYSLQNVTPLFRNAILRAQADLVRSG